MVGENPSAMPWILALLELEVAAEAGAEAQQPGPVSQLPGAAPHSPAFSSRNKQCRTGQRSSTKLKGKGMRGRENAKPHVFLEQQAPVTLILLNKMGRVTQT